jgi:hypothetical protein
LAEQIKKGQFKVRETESDDVGTVERGACRLTPFADPQYSQSPAHLITKASLHQSRLENIVGKDWRFTWQPLKVEDWGNTP